MREEALSRAPGPATLPPDIALLGSETRLASPSQRFGTVLCLSGSAAGL